MEERDRVDGRVCMITGASNGIGKAAALELAARGAHLVLVCRDRARGEATAAEIVEATGSRDVDLRICDLSSQEQIRGLAMDYIATGRPLHVLLNNAGVVNTRRAVTSDGLEETFAVNHIGYFLLTNLLLDRLIESAPARIVNVSSDAHRMAGPMNFDDLQSERSYSTMRVYGQSKLANLLFTRELARRLDGTGVTVNAVHPGGVRTGFGRNNRGLLPRAALALFAPFARSPEKGAETPVWLSSSPEVAEVSGAYFKDCAEIAPNEHARSEADARRLWEISSNLVGFGSG